MNNELTFKISVALLQMALTSVVTCKFLVVRCSLLGPREEIDPFNLIYHTTTNALLYCNSPESLQSTDLPARDTTYTHTHDMLPHHRNI